MRIRVQLYLCFLTVCAVQGLIRIKTCPGKKADIVFMLDESRSIWYKHFFNQLNFVRQVAMTYKISPNAVRIGMVTWSTRALKHWDLNQFNSKPMLLHKIFTVRQSGGTQTNTHLALTMVRHMFKQNARPGADKLVILMTDGASSRKGLTAREGAKLLADGVRVYSIGVGHNVAMDEVCSISSTAAPPVEEPEYDDEFGDYDYLDEYEEPEPEVKRQCFQAKNFEALNTKLKDELIESTCEIKEILTGECNATIEADVAFVLGSVHQNPPGAKQTVGFIRTLIASKNMFLGPVQLALVPEDYISLGFGFKTYGSNRSSTLSHLDYALTRFETTADLLNTMQDRTFSELEGHRPGVRKVAVVMLDRPSASRKETIRSAAAARKKGVEIVSVGIGKQFDKVEWSRIASNRKMRVRIPTYDALWKSANETLWFHICP